MSEHTLYVVGQLVQGGAERQLTYLLRSMDRGVHRPAVAVWNFVESDYYTPHLRALGVPLYPLGPGRSVGAKLRSLRRIVKELQPGVVHTYNFYLNFAAWWATLGLRSIAIGCIRGDFTSERRYAGSIVGRLCARWPAVQICNSLAAQENVERTEDRFRPRRVFFVRNGMDVGAFVPQPLPLGTPALLGVGRLIHLKRWDRFLTVIASAASQRPGFNARLAGDGPLLGDLRAQAKQLGVEEMVQFLGRRDDIPTLLAGSHCLLHTADEEGCANVVMEAMAGARPVVATDAGDAARLIEDGLTGFVTCRGDDVALVERIVALLNDRRLCERMGEAARAKAEREFGLDRLVAETLAAYRAAGWR